MNLIEKAINHPVIPKYYRDYMVSRLAMPFFEKQIIPANETILFSGYPKSGNTWARFVIFNYFNILNRQGTETLKYSELNAFQNGVFEFRIANTGSQGLPNMVRTHTPIYSFMKGFNKKVYVHRNPLDTLISFYYWHHKRTPPFPDTPFYMRERLADPNELVKEYFHVWRRHYDVSIKNADFVLNYSKMKTDPIAHFSDFFNTMGWSVEQAVLVKSIELSSFDSIKQMGRNSNEKEGMAQKKSNSEHTRSGQEGQFRSELNEETIDWVFQEMPDFQELYGKL